jgi:hypothetical protein
VLYVPGTILLVHRIIHFLFFQKIGRQTRHNIFSYFEFSYFVCVCRHGKFVVGRFLLEARATELVEKPAGEGYIFFALVRQVNLGGRTWIRHKTQWCVCAAATFFPQKVFLVGTIR